jgi:secreted trypsin-like serine protease
LGEFNLKQAGDGELDFNVEKIIAHPEFNPKTFRNDIALVKLSQNVTTFNESIWPACLAGMDQPKMSSSMLDAVDNRTAWVLGFGQTSYNGRTSDQLRQADLKIVPHAKCKRAFAHLVKLTRDYVCASSQYDSEDAAKSTGKLKDSCQGDSGGPLMMMASEDEEAPTATGDTPNRETERWYIYGIVSFGFKCAVPNFAGVYCRVNRYLEWISANIDV